MDSLARFLPIFHRIEADGINEEKLTQIRLPYALKRLYSVVGNWTGKGFLGSPFSKQDAFVPFELLFTGMEDHPPAKIPSGKSIFVIENQGVWSCAVDNIDDSDEFYLELGPDDNPWTKMPFSLSHFLVTFTILESSYSAKYRGKAKAGKSIEEILDMAGYRAVPLWNGYYVSSRGASTTKSRFLTAAGMEAIVLGSSLSTNSNAVFDKVKDQLIVSEEVKGETIQPGSPSWDRIGLKQQKWHFEYKAREFQKKVDHFSDRVAEMEWHMNEIQKKMNESDEEK